MTAVVSAASGVIRGISAQRLVCIGKQLSEGENSMGTFSIRVVDEDGTGVSGAKVSCHYPLTYQTEYTDSEGWATFDVHGGIASFPVVDTLYINGVEVATSLATEDGDTFSYTQP